MSATIYLNKEERKNCQMKKMLVLLAIAAVTVLAGKNLVPNGDFKDPKGKKAHIRILRPGAKAAYKGNFIVTEASNARATVEINCHRLTGFTPGKRCYIRMPFEVTSFDPQFANAASVRAIFWDAKGKAMSKFNSFSRQVKITGVGKYDIFHAVRVPAGAQSCSLSFWLDGVKGANVTALHFTAKRSFLS